MNYLQKVGLAARLMVGGDYASPNDSSSLKEAIIGGLGSAVSVDDAVSSATVYACVELIASSISRMPVQVRKMGEGRGMVENDHKFEKLWNLKPNSLHSAATFVERIIVQMLLCGNAYVWIQRGPTGGGVRALWLLDEAVVDVQSVATEDDVQKHFVVSSWNDGYYANSPQRQATIIQNEDMLHFQGFLSDGLVGKSVIRTGARTATFLERIISKFSNVTYLKGALQQFAVTTPQKMDTEQIKAIRDQWEESNSTGVEGAGLPIVLAGGADVKQLQQTMRDLELNGSREFQISDVARAFHVPGILINQENKSTSWGTGIQTTVQGFLTFGLMPHLNRIEAEINMKLFADGREYVRFQPDRLLRGSPKERNENYRIMLGGGGNPGYKSVNEIRELEGDPAMEGDDYEKPYVPPRTPQLDVNTENNQ